MEILIVSDSPERLHHLQAILTNAGYRSLYSVSSAAEALGYLGMDEGDAMEAGRSQRAFHRTMRVAINVILLDLQSATFDGYELTTRIKGIEALRDTPILMLVAMTDPYALNTAQEAGVFDFVPTPINPLEVLARVRAARQMKHEMDQRKARERELRKVMVELQQAYDASQRVSRLDPLTGVANRRQFDAVLEKEWQRGIREHRPLSLLLLDLDAFKAYNDILGHQAGDRCLQQVAQALQETLHRPGDLVVRYGGEEFAIILPETPEEGSQKMAEFVRGLIEALGVPHPASPVKACVTASIGVATRHPAHHTTPAVLVGAADYALYQAKEAGRNRIHVASLSPLAPLHIRRKSDQSEDTA